MIRERLSDNIEEANRLVKLMAQTTTAASVFADPRSQLVQQANQEMDWFSQALPGSVCYLMDPQGETIASSNCQEPDSFLGRSYAFRPYFQQAMQGSPGQYFAIGVTSKDPGYYASRPAHNATGKVIGVAVIKRPVDDLIVLSDSETLAFIVSPQGIILAANLEKYTLKSLWHLSEETNREITASRQFGKGPFLPVLSQEPLDHAICLLNEERYLVLRQPLALEGWSVVLLSGHRPVVMARLTGIAITLFFVVGLLGLITVSEVTLDAASKTAASERLYRSVLAGSPNCVLLCDREGKFLTINDKCLSDMGKGKDDLLSQRFLDIWNEATKPLAEAAVQEILLGRQTSFTGVYNHADGRLISWEVVLNPLLDPGQNDIFRFVCILTDVTARKLSEAELYQEKEKYRSLADESPLGVAIIDGDGQYKYVNRKFEKIFGYDLANISSINDWLLTVYPDSPHRQLTLSTWMQDLKKLGVGEVTSHIFKVSCQDISPKIINFRSVPLESGNYLVIYEDITERQLGAEALEQANQKLHLLVSISEERNRKITLLNEMSKILQSCHTYKEAFSAFKHFITQVFPEDNGALYVLNAPKGLYEAVTAWGSPPPPESSFIAADCWSLRRGRPHLAAGSDSAMLCPHVSLNFGGVSLCMPMAAQGIALGMLHLRLTPPDQLDPSVRALGDPIEFKRSLASTIAENLSLTLANIELRKSLRSQAIRDPLTGLFNRRYLEETMGRELHRAGRLGLPVGFIMVDIDYFKTFNDKFGHQAGDKLLQTFGKLIKSMIRREDIVTRYGGEEFLVIMPGAGLELTLERAERLRQAVKDMAWDDHGRDLSLISISLGVSVFPDHGSEGEELIRAADKALYRAKQAGRDRVMVTGQGA